MDRIEELKENLENYYKEIKAKIEELKKKEPKKRWRAKRHGTYYLIYGNLNVEDTVEVFNNVNFSNVNFSIIDLFSTVTGILFIPDLLSLVTVPIVIFSSGPLIFSTFHTALFWSYVNFSTIGFSSFL